MPKQLRKSNTNWQLATGRKCCKTCSAITKGRVVSGVPFCNTLLANTADNRVCDMWEKK